MQGAIKRGEALGLNADDFDIGLDGLGRHGNAGDQPAAAHRHYNAVKVRAVGQHLQGHGALAGDHVGVVEGVDEGKIFLGRQFFRIDGGIIELIAVEHHFGAEFLGLLDLHEGRGRGHDDGGRHAELLRMISDALGVVAGGGRDHPLGALFRRQAEELVQGAALLEGGGKLQVLELDPNLSPGHLRQRQRLVEGGSNDRALQARRGSAHVVKGHGKALGRRF